LTLISRMMRRHRRVVSVSGNARYWCGADEMFNVFEPALPFELGGTRFKAPRHETLTAPRSWSYATDELIDRYRNTGADYSDELRQSLRHVIGYVKYRHAITPPEGTRFVDKSQVYTVKLGLIDSLLADVEPRYVLVTRNPYVSCYRAAIGKAADMERYKNSLTTRERLRLCAQHWSNSIRAFLEDSQDIHGEGMSLKFENFLKTPEASIRDFCEFIDIPFRQSMLPAESDTFPLGTRYRDRWYPLRQDVNEKYHDQIGPEEIDIIDDYCGALAKRLGYTPPQNGI